MKQARKSIFPLPFITQPTTNTEKELTLFLFAHTYEFVKTYHYYKEAKLLQTGCNYKFGGDKIRTIESYPVKMIVSHIYTSYIINADEETSKVVI